MSADGWVQFPRDSSEVGPDEPLPEIPLIGPDDVAAETGERHYSTDRGTLVEVSERTDGKLNVRTVSLDDPPDPWPRGMIR